MNILVTGSNGQLGSEFKVLSKTHSKFKFIFIDKEDLDITDLDKVKNYFSKNLVDVCINGAAYTAVDKAETDSINAFNVNEFAVKYISEACKINNTKLIQISTDFVFDGKSKIAYTEEDKTEPLSVYGQSKLNGELNALENNNLVIRTSWLYSSFGNNFVKTMIRLGTDRTELNVIEDQIGTPTYAKDLAEMIINLIANNNISKLNGLYHFSNDGKASWYDFAKEIFKIKKIDCKVNPIPTTEYPTPAERPKFSLMDKSKIEQDFNVKLVDWKDSLDNCLKLL